MGTTQSALKAWETKRKNGFHGIKSGKESPNFKKDGIVYSAIHAYASKNFGTPNLCEECGTITAKRYDWANKSGKYLRKRNDWIRLCRKCHLIFDGTIKNLRNWQGKQIYA